MNLNEISIAYQNEIDERKRKQLGIYYTPISLTDQIIEKAFNKPINKPIWKTKVLEPCVGVGNFIFSYLHYVNNKYDLTSEQAHELIHNIYVCDADKNALIIYFNSLKKIAREIFNIDITEEYKTNNIGGPLLFDLCADRVEYLPIDNYFGNLKFDFIMTNPPYKSFRAEKRHYANLQSYEQDRNKYLEIKKITKEHFNISGTSSPNFFKLFIEKIITEYSNIDCKIAVLIPTSILTDQSSFELRKKMIISCNLESISRISENNPYISAAQAMSILIMTKGNKQSKITIQNDIHEKAYTVDPKKVIIENQGFSIIIIKKNEYEQLNAMNKIPKLKDFSFISNKRGELDLTLDKEFITNTSTKFPLIKGRNINFFNKVDSNTNIFVKSDFINTVAKKEIITKPRIACQQIVNMNKKRRLSFSLVPPNNVLGNSCNFIVVKENPYNIDIYYLLGILNSKQLDWYFKLFSSNNHVNNYDLDNLPLPIGDLKTRISISEKVQSILDNYDEKLMQILDSEISSLFNSTITEEVESTNNTITLVANKDEVQLNKIIVSKYYQNGILEKNRCLSGKFVMNNTSYKLSELDLEMINAIPQGGNWTNIPQVTKNKSKRLLGIQKTGGRTTLYGRLDYNKPAYTITTYFNRPGNGSYIHPTRNRVITTREAARLQAFKDEYLFVGNQKDILNQIGNAVPPLMGYLLGKSIKDKVDVTNSLDLFSGAGGLLSGMKYAGINHILANDIDINACATIKLNNPEINVICDDITNQEVKDKIINISINSKIDIICGGPPCQGFSLAGYRKENDPRNKLFLDFVHLIEKISPKIFVFENVVGLLSSQNGKVYSDIKEVLTSLGYHILGQTLDFSNYGIPQRRKRVILIGVRRDLKINPNDLFPEMFTESESSKITTKEAIKDLESLNNNIYEEIPDDYSSLYTKLMRGLISEEEYYKALKKNKQLNKWKYSANQQLSFDL